MSRNTVYARAAYTSIDRHARRTHPVADRFTADRFTARLYVACAMLWLVLVIVFA